MQRNEAAVDPSMSPSLRRPITYWLITRATVLWCLTRLSCAFLFWLLPDQPDAHRLIGGTVASIEVFVMTSALTMLDLRRRNEMLFISNLGVHPSRVVAVVTVVPLFLEVLVSTVR